MIKLLIIDDEQEVLDLFKDLFQKKNYDVICSSSGETALQVIENNKPDFVLLDINMPHMDGMQVLEEIKKKAPSIGVVMLTAYGYDDQLIDKAMEKGASGYISKNLPLQQIVHTFNTLLRSIKKKM